MNNEKELLSPELSFKKCIKKMRHGLYFKYNRKLLLSKVNWLSKIIKLINYLITVMLKEVMLGHES